MSRVELVISDSSSPPLPLSELSVTPKRHQRVVPSTSTPDSLPSPSELPNVHTCIDKRLKSGSRAVRAPTGTNLGVKSDSGLLKEGQLHSEDESCQTREEARKNTTLAAGPKLTTKELKAKDTPRRNGHGKLKRPSKVVEIETPEKVDARESEHGPDQDTLKPARNGGGDFQHYDRQADFSPLKSRPSPAGQNDIKAATKFAAKGKSKPRRTNSHKRFSDESRPKKRSSIMKTAKPKKSTGKVSRHFAQANTSVQDFEPVQLAQFKEPRIEATLQEESDCVGNAGRMPAPKHRLDRTPPKNRSHETAVIDLKRVSLSPLSASLDFCGLLQNFARVDAGQETKLAPTAAATRQTSKRKRTELAEPTTACTVVDETSPAAEPENHVSKRRTRPKTVTEYAIERFRADNEQPVPADDTSSRFFGPSGKASRRRSTLPTDVAQQNPKARRPGKRAKITGAGKATKATKSTKAPAKATVAHPPLLNPEMAAQRIARQEERHKFLFGTSSQLAGEKSPTILRAIQQSLKEMEKGDTTGFIGVGTKGRLWAIGSKIEDASLLDELDKNDTTLPQGESFDRRFVISQWSTRPIADEKETDSAFRDMFAAEHNDSTRLTALTDPSTGPHPQRPVTGKATANLETSPVCTVRTTSPSSTRVALRTLSANTSPQICPRGHPSKTAASEISKLQRPASTAKPPRDRPRKPTNTQEGCTIQPTSSQPRRASHAKPSSTLRKRPTHVPKAARGEEISDSEAESSLTPSPPQRREQARSRSKKAASAELEIISSQEMAAIESSSRSAASEGFLLARFGGR